MNVVGEVDIYIKIYVQFIGTSVQTCNGNVSHTRGHLDWVLKDK